MIQDGRLGVRHLGFPTGMVLAISYLHVALILFIKFRVNWPSGLREEFQNRLFKMAAMVSILDFQLEQFSYF